MSQLHRTQFQMTMPPPSDKTLQAPLPLATSWCSKVRGESALGGDHFTPPAANLPTFLQQTLQAFQDREMMECLGIDPLQGRAAKGLGEFLVASSLAITKVQNLQTKMQ